MAGTGEPHEQLSRSERETEEVARRVGSRLTAGALLLLEGNLGAGKTAFVRGLARGLDADPEDVCSPTFALVHEYRGGRLTLYHADLYRLDAAAAAELGLDELGARDGVVAVEWPDRLSHVPSDAVRVRLDWVDETTRRITIRGAEDGADRSRQER